MLPNGISQFTKNPLSVPSNVMSDYTNNGLSGKVISISSANPNPNGNIFEKASSALDNWLTGNRDWSRTQQQNAFNASEAKKNRDWQEYMSNTAYSRAYKDLTSLGINPYVMFGGGASAASTPTGSSGRSAGSHHSGGNVVGDLLKLATFFISQGANIGSSSAMSVANQYTPNTLRYHSKAKFLRKK